MGNFIQNIPSIRLVLLPHHFSADFPNELSKNLRLLAFFVENYRLIHQKLAIFWAVGRFQNNLQNEKLRSQSVIIVEVKLFKHRNITHLRQSVWALGLKESGELLWRKIRVFGLEYFYQKNKR